MQTANPSGQPRLLIYEPFSGGHHPVWLGYITEDLLDGSFELVLALDRGPSARERTDPRLEKLVSRIEIISIHDEQGRLTGGGTVQNAVHCLRRARAAGIFFTSLDEIASACLRRAALGLNPPSELRGIISGIYFRPRFLEPGGWSPNYWLKKIGFRRLAKAGWFNHLWLLDERLVNEAQSRRAGFPLHFLPDPYPEHFEFCQAEARRKLGLEPGRPIFLFYGGPYRRKGLHLAVEAMSQAGPSAFFLCVGEQTRDPKTAAALERLVGRGQARVMNEYVSDLDEQLCFAAADAVLLPYIRHFGSSGVLSLAAAAGKPVIASDEELVGDRVRRHELGWLFPSGDVASLVGRIRQAMSMTPEEAEQWNASAKRYAALCSRRRFREALLKLQI